MRAYETKRVSLSVQMVRTEQPCMLQSIVTKSLEATWQLNNNKNIIKVLHFFLPQDKYIKQKKSKHIFLHPNELSYSSLYQGRTYAQDSSRTVSLALKYSLT